MAETSAPTCVKIQTERADLVVIDHDFGLRLVDLGIDERREEELAALHRLGLKLLRKFQHALRLFGREQHDFDREVVRRRGGQGA